MRIVPVAYTSQQVQFTSDAGEAVVTWMGTEPPPLGEAIDVELEIDQVPLWSDLEVVDAKPGLFRVPDAVVRGRVVAVGDDGVLTLLVAGAILLLETRGKVPDGLVGKVVQFQALYLAAYPTNV